MTASSAPWSSPPSLTALHSLGRRRSSLTRDAGGCRAIEQGGRDAKSIVDYGMAQAKKLVSGRVSGKAGGDKGSKGGGGSGKNQVVELSSADFDAKVLKSDDYWLVEFFAPWFVPRLPHPTHTRAHTPR